MKRDATQRERPTLVSYILEHVWPKQCIWFIALCQSWIASINIFLSGFRLCDVFIDELLLNHCSWCTMVQPLQKGLVAPQRQAVAAKLKDQVQQKSACTSHVNLIFYPLDIEDNKARQWLDNYIGFDIWSDLFCFPSYYFCTFDQWTKWTKWNKAILFPSETEKTKPNEKELSTFCCQHWWVSGSPEKGEQHWQNGDVDCGVPACCHQGFDGSLFPLLSLDQWEWSWTKRVKRENYLKIVLKLSQYVSKCFLIVVSKLSKLMTHCSHCRLLINGRGRGQKKGLGPGQKGWKGKRKGWETGNALHESDCIVNLSTSTELSNFEVTSLPWKIKRGNYYFCPPVENWSA